jgi:hypothetical protein
MNLLQNHMKEHRYTGAIFSEEKDHRFALWRTWDRELPSILFIGLNPSRGNQFYNDPTLTRCINFSKSWGYGTMFFGNLFSNVEPDSDMMRAISMHESRIDEVTTNLWLDQMLSMTDEVVCAWGSWDFIERRKKAVIGMISNWFESPKCFGKNKDGNPKHPLYLKATSTLKNYPL